MEINVVQDFILSKLRSKKIELCDTTCKDVKSHDDAALNVVFGCDVAIDPK